MIAVCSSRNAEIIKSLLTNGAIPMCPYSIGFIDACILGGDYFLLVSYFGEKVGEAVLRLLEQQEHYEDCMLLKDCLDEYRDNLEFCDDYVI